jgi:N-formylglutamate amidohydrolase
LTPGAATPNSAAMDGPDASLTIAMPHDAANDAAPAPFDILRNVPEGAPPASPLIFASPHSGRVYPAEMMQASALDAAEIRRSEDAYVDSLIAGGAAHGATVLTNRYARAYVDVNREPYELDPGMFEDELPAFAVARSARVAAGLGAIARVVADGQEIYTRKLTFAEAQGRIEAVHTPYHAALTHLIQQAKAQFDRAVVIDWHSMPSAAARGGGGGGPDFVLGDRFGQACAAPVLELVERTLQGFGYKVVRNNPYAGGFTTEHYGRPASGVHALQVEIDRSLYLDEGALQANAGYERLKLDLDRLFAVLAATV